jgi:transcriptional regulator with XRE-family HTH domain
MVKSCQKYGIIHKKLVLMPARESWRNVGHKIRYLRKANQLTIRQLAAGSGLSANAISLVERGEVAPTVETLCKVASALGVPASSLLQGICPSQVILTRAGDYYAGQPAERALGALACAVTPSEPRPPPTIYDLAGNGEADMADYSHAFVLCLGGKIEHEADGKCYQLEPGDSLSFNGNILHCCRNPGQDTAVAVLILHPESRGA